MYDMAKEAKKDGIPSIDPESFRFNADNVADWAIKRK
jgi:hypothetical protein